MSNTVAVAHEQIRHHDSLGSDRLFYVIAASMMLIFTAIGFRPFYLHGKGIGGGEMTSQIVTLIVVHGLAMFGWVILFFLQSILILASAPSGGPPPDDVAGHDVYHFGIARPVPLHRKPCSDSAVVRLPSDVASRRHALPSSMGHDPSHESVVRIRLCWNCGGLSAFHRARQERTLGVRARKLCSINPA